MGNHTYTYVNTFMHHTYLQAIMSILVLEKMSVLSVSLELQSIEKN